MRSPTTVFTKCLKIKLKVNMESQESFLAVVWAEGELWRLMVLLHTVWEFMESPAHHLILVHQTDEASCCPNPEFPNETAWTEGSGIILLWVFSCRCRKLIKPLIHLISPAPWVCQLFQGEIAKVTIPCAVRKNPISAARAGADPPWATSASATSTTWLTAAKSFSTAPGHIHGTARTLQPFSEPQTTSSSHLLATVSFHWSLVHESP